MSSLTQLMKRVFATRELYIRSNGQVRFITLTPRSQFMAFMMSILVVGSLVTTALVIFFEDQIVAFRTLQNENLITKYQTQITELETALTTMENKNQITQSWFEEVTNTIETRHNELTEVFEKHASITNQLNQMRNTYVDASRKVTRQKGKTKIVASASQSESLHFESRLTTGVDNVAQFTLSDVPEISNRKNHQSENLDILTGKLDDRINRLFVRQQELLDALEVSSDKKILEAKAIIAETKIGPIDEFVAQISEGNPSGIGGPYIPVAANDPNIPEDVKKQLTRIGNNLETLANLNLSIASLPLARPVHYYKTTSDFGPRKDPINQRVAFHSGLDFGAPAGTKIHATLPGKVVKAGRKGPYGKLVEIDHGNGLRTRYAHMQSISVSVGQEVAFHEVIGKVGSSGRSTGPHLHYEIWHNGKIKNPIHFIRSGKHIFPTYLANTMGGN